MRKIPVYYYSSSSNLTGRFAEALARIDGRRVLNLARSEVRRSELLGKPAERIGMRLFDPCAVLQPG